MAYESESPLSTGAPNNSTETANVMSSGVWNKAELSSSADVDYYKIIVGSAGLIKLDFSHSLVTTTETWKLALLDANGDYLTQLGTTSVGAPVVSGNSNTGTSLLVSGLSSAVAIGSRFTFATTSADTTIYTVVGATTLSGGQSTLTLDKAMSGTPTAATALVFAPTQTGVSSTSASLVGNVAAAGTYFVQVNAANWSDADYQVKATFVPTLESTLSNETKALAAEAGNRLVTNAWMTGALAAQSDVDTWVFTTAAASDFYIDFAAATGDDSAPEWEITLSTWSGDQALTSVQGVGLSGSVGKAGSYKVESAKYSTATTFVVSIAAKSGVTYDPGNYTVRARGDTLDLNDTPVITVDTVGSGKPNEYITTDVVRSLKVSTTEVPSQVALKTLFSVSDADVSAGTQTIATYKVALTPAQGENASAEIKIIDGNTSTTYSNGSLMTAAQMDKAYIVAGSLQGNLDLVIQAFDSSNAADASGTSSNVHQTVRLVSQATGVSLTTDGTLALTERATSTESGYSEALSFKLSSAPTNDVLVYLEQATPNQLSLSKTVLTFTAENYATEQVVTATAVADSLTEDNHNAALSFRVVSSDTAYDGLAVSSQSFTLADPMNHAPQGSVTLAGTARVGQALSASNTLTDSDTLGELNYQWERLSDATWSPIANANTSAYVLTTSDLGAKVRVKVSYLDGLKNSESVSSDASSTVSAAGGYELSGSARLWKSSSSVLKEVVVGGGGQTATSDATGAFMLSGMTQSSGSSLFTLTASKAITPAKAADAGVTLTDVLAALKVYLGKELPSSYKSSFNYVAADFDANGVVNLTDVLSLLKYYLGKTTTATPAWAFVDAADMDSNGLIATSTTGTLSKSAATPHLIDVEMSTSNTVELVGVLRGDVDGSWMPS